MYGTCVFNQTETSYDNFSTCTLLYATSTDVVRIGFEMGVEIMLSKMGLPSKIVTSIQMIPFILYLTWNAACAVLHVQRYPIPRYLQYYAIAL